MDRFIPQQAKEFEKQIPKRRTKTSQIFKAAVSLALCLTLFVGLISPQIVWAASDALAQMSTVSEDTESHESIYDNAIDIQNISDDEIVSELTNGRDANTKFFRLTDGTTIAAVYDEPVHIKDSSGTWQNIDYRLSDTGDGYENQSEYNTMRVKFSKNPKNGKLYTLKTDDGQIKWSLLGVKESKKDAKLSQKTKNSSKLDVNNISGMVSYEDILPGVTLQYLVTEGKLKENIVFASLESAGPMQFELQTNKFDVTLEDNVIYFNNENGEAVFTMTAPYMIDNDGVLSDKIILSLSGEKNHYTVTVTPDAQWLKNAAYPVIVDPAWEYVMLGRTNNESSTAYPISNTFVCSKNPTSSEWANIETVVVGVQNEYYEKARGIFKFALPTRFSEKEPISSSNRVVAASLQLSVFSFNPRQGNETMTVNAHQITSNVGVATATWNKLNGNYSPIVSDSQVIKSSDKVTETSVPRIPFDITDMVRYWYENGENYGLALVSENENTSHVSAGFFSSNFDLNRFFEVPQNCLPSLVIQYANSNGIENNFTYHSVGNSEVGTVSVNDFTGNLIYTFDDVWTNGNLFPITVSHIFDNAYRNEERYEHTNGCVGRGFRLNLYERILVCDMDGYPYTYVDSDGTIHYLKTKDANQKLYVDEYYPNRVLKVVNKSDGTPDYYKLTDGSNIETKFNSDGFVVQKTDTTNDQIAQIIYKSGTDAVEIISDGAGKEIFFEYITIDGMRYLNSISEPSGRAISFDYYNDQLIRINRSGDRTIVFGYDNDNCLTRIRAEDNSCIDIEYYSKKYNDVNSLKRVKSIEQVGTNNDIKGGKLTFVYENGETIVTDREGKTETLMFDDFGQTVSVRDHAGRGTFLKYNSLDATEDVNPNKTSDTGDTKSKATQLAYTTKMQSTVTNFVSNPDFEDSTLTKWNFENSTNSGTGEAVLSTQEAYQGNKSLKVTSTSMTGRYGYQQSVPLPSLSIGETYTISAYVKVTDLTIDATDSVSGAIVYFGYQYEDNGAWDIKTSEPVTTVGDWVRISRTFTIPENLTTMIAKIGLYKSTGTAYFDNVQIERQSVANPYNYIDNGDFGDAVGTAVPFAYTVSNLNSSNDKVVSYDNRNCFKITGERTKEKRIEQTVNVSGDAGERFTFNAWAKSTGALSPKGSFFGGDRDFAIRVIFNNTDGSETKHIFEFENKATGWQFLAGEAVADKNYSSIKIAFVYNNQKNDAFVDDICLFKEGSNVSYTYDNWGRVETVENIADSGNKVTEYLYVVDDDVEDTSVEYDDRVSKITYPDSTSESYTYDNKKRVKTHVDTSGVKTTYNYDDYGNLTGTTVTQNGNSGSSVLVGNTTGYTTNGNYANTVTDPFGNVTTSVIDEEKGLVTSTTNPNNITTHYTYNQDTDRLTSVRLGNSEIHYGYNSSGAISRISHSAMFGYDVEYFFDYDELGRRVCTYVGTQDIIGHFYDEDSDKIVQDYYANGFSKQYEYNDLDNVTKISYNNIDKYTWDYDYMGRVGLHKDLENNQEFRYTYDSKGRVESAVSRPTAAGFSKSTFKNTFNAKDQLSGVTRKVGGTTLNATYTYSNSGRLNREQYTNGSAKSYEYDDVGRLSYQITRNSAHNNIIHKWYEYIENIDEGTTTSMVGYEEILLRGKDYEYFYDYDAKGNIANITLNDSSCSYYYDELNQLRTVINGDISYGYEYDEGGNILSKSGGIDDEYIEFGYGDENWKDLLTEYDNQEITYDQIGNPLLYRDGMTFTWQGRRLATASVNGNSLSFKYNSDGIRTQKTVNGVTTYFTLDGSKIISQKKGNQEIFFEYDAQGNVATMIYNGQTYHYVRNLTGEILGLTDNNGNMVAEYFYDPWGEIIDYNNYGNLDLANLNPFKYKDYYYDSELGFYYLNSRYYDPEICRFINADSVDLATATPAELTDKNLFAYCDNNPITRADNGGEFWHIVAGAAVGALIGGISSIVGQAVSGKKINWGEVAVSAASGAITGAITAACPAMGAVATGVVHGVVGAGTYAATELVNGRTPTIEGTVVAGVTSGVLAGGTKAIGNAISSGKLEIGKIKGVRAPEGYPGVRYKTNAGPAYSVELHSSHNGHTPHLQVNKWLYQYKGYEGQPYRFRSWHYEFFKPWKGVY